MNSKSLLLNFIFICLFNFCKGQRLPVNPFTYGTPQIIDGYFGEVDSLLQIQQIKTMKIYLKTDSTILIEVVNYDGGRKTSLQEFNYDNGKLERSIGYSYGNDFVEAEIIHYPSKRYNNLLPAKQYHDYLMERRKDGSHTLYKKDDTVTNIVRMRMRHTWDKDGTIHFQTFDREGKLVVNNVLTPHITFEEYQRLPKQVYPGTIDKGDELYKYNAKGKLVLYQVKSMERERKYFYDEKELLTRIESWQGGKLVTERFFEYE